MEQLEKFPISKKIISFVLPMGYSFNLDGSMMYCTFAVLFIAQAYNIELPLGQQITMLLLLMLTSKGMAGVPRASLVVIAATLASFNIPEAGLLLIIGIDQFLDMGRSATNVIGNTLATAAIAKWEGEQVDLPKLEAAHAPKAPDACHAREVSQEIRRRVRVLGRSGIVVAVLSVLLLAVPAGAQEAANVAALSGTLKKVKDTGTITLGYRESSLPFSYLNRRQQPIGYAIDLCREIVEDLSTELDGMEIKIAFAPVTPADRLQKVAAGEIDLECGSTTGNVQRRKEVAFSPIFFVAGTKLMVPKSSPIRSYRDLAGKTAAAARVTRVTPAMRIGRSRMRLPFLAAACPIHINQPVTSEGEMMQGGVSLLSGEP